MLIAIGLIIGLGGLAVGYRKVGKPIPGLLKVPIVFAVIWIVIRTAQFLVWLSG